MPAPLRYILADDDDLYRSVVQQQLSLIPGIVCVAECRSAFETADECKLKHPDFLLLDIEMPGLSGIELAANLENKPLFIFISSHAKYAVDAFEIDAVDYIVKPASNERLFKAIERVKQLVELKQNTKYAEGIRLEDNESFFIKDKGNYVKIYYDDVVYMQAMSDFVYIYLLDGSKKVALVNLKNLEAQLPPGIFLRISRTHAIHRKKVTAVDQSTVQLGKIQLSVGTTYADNIITEIVGKQGIKRYI